MSTIDVEQATGVTHLDAIRNSNSFTNRAIYEQMITYCHVDAFATNTDHGTKLEEHHYYDVICQVQDEQDEQLNEPAALNNSKDT